MAAAFLIFLFLLSWGHLGFSTHRDEWAQCEKALRSAGASRRFAAYVGHSIHYMTIEDLKKFESLVDENNNVPVTNKNLDAKDIILLNAPHRATSSSHFLTSAMQHFDQVMNHKDQKWDIAEFNTLERVHHALHMDELWAHILNEYQKLKVAPVDDATCACATDVNNNGIMNVLKIIALLLRDGRDGSEYDKMVPKLTNGKYYYDQRLTDLTLLDADAALLPISVLIRDHVGHSGKSWPTLLSDGAWEIWKGANRMPDAMYKDAALYLHCALRKYADTNDLAIFKKHVPVEV